MSENHSNNDDLDQIVDADSGYERHDVDVTSIVVCALVCIVAVVVSIFGLDTFFMQTKERLIREANQYEPVALLELQAQETAILNSYGVINKEKKQYRIPVSEAMKILAEEAFEQ